MRYFMWNYKETMVTTVWNPSINGESMETTYVSLKERMRNPVNGKRDSDQLADIGKGIAMIMDYIESKENDQK